MFSDVVEDEEGGHHDDEGEHHASHDGTEEYELTLRHLKEEQPFKKILMNSSKGLPGFKDSREVWKCPLTLGFSSTLNSDVRLQNISCVEVKVKTWKPKLTSFGANLTNVYAI